MLNPCAKRRAAPGARFGATSFSKSSGCAPSGTRKATSCAPRTASAKDATVRPASSAAAADGLPSRNPTTTSTPDSCRFSACACPWLPYPSTATFPLSRSALPALMISAMWEIPFGSDVDGGLRTTCLTIPSRCAGAAEADAAGANELAHTIGPNELFEGLDLVGAADELEGDRIAADVGDLRARDLTERDELGTPVGSNADRDQRELALDGFVGPQLGDAQDVHELVHLLLDLLERVLAAVDAQGQPRDVRPFRRADGEALDVVAAPREELRNARQRAGAVLEPNGD